MDRQVTMQCLQVLLCWFNVFSCYNGHGWQKVQAVNEYNLSIACFLCHAKNSYKENAICFLSSHSLEKKCHVQSPDPLRPLNLHERVVVLKVSSCFSVVFLFFSLAFFVCISMSLIHPFHCLEFHQPGLTCLYTQWHTVSKVSPHTIFLRFSRQDCHCWFVSVEQEPHSTVIYLHCFVSHSPSSARLSAL